jgi:hypothetical protein
VDAPNPEICWCAVDGFTVTAFGAGVPFGFIVEPELEPDPEELDDPASGEEVEPDEEPASDEELPPEEELAPAEVLPLDEELPPEEEPPPGEEPPPEDEVPPREADPLEPELALEFEAIEESVPELALGPVSELGPGSPVLVSPEPQEAKTEDTATAASMYLRLRDMAIPPAKTMGGMP